MNYEKLEKARLEWAALICRRDEAAASLKHANEQLVMLGYTLESWRRNMPSIGRFPEMEAADKAAVRQLPDLLDNPAAFQRIVRKYEIRDAYGIAEQLVETHRRIALAAKLHTEANAAVARMGAWFHPVDRFAKSLGY